MADDDKVDIAALDKDGGIPELCRRTSQPYDYSEKQLEEKTHVSAKEAFGVGHSESGKCEKAGCDKVHGDAGKKSGGCGKAGCQCNPCTCGASCKCGDSGAGSKLSEGGNKGCGKPNCKCDDCKCGSNCQC